MRANSTSFLADLVGQAPWPAADLLVGLLERSKSRTGGSGADQGIRPARRRVVLIRVRNRPGILSRVKSPDPRKGGLPEREGGQPAAWYE